MMKIPFIALAAVACLAGGCSQKEHVNPFLAESFGTPYEIPPFEQITFDDYLPAVEAGIAAQKAAIDSIVANPDTPTFENTILAMDHSGDLLQKVMLVFSGLDESLSSPEMVELAEKIYPMTSAHSDEIAMNDALFQRVKYLHDNIDSLGLGTPERRMIEESYKSFTRNGALLDADKKARLKELNTTLTDLYLKFNKNLLTATNAFEIVVEDSARLAGLPASSVAVAAEEASARGLDGKWVFTLHAPSRLPLLQYAADRDLRRQMYEGYASLASSGDTDNRPVINKILRARAEKADLLGFKDFAAYQTDNVMAKTPEAAEALLMKLWEPSVKRVHEEVAEMQAIADREGGDFKIAPWDYYYYAEKVRKDKYDFDESEVRPYLSVDSVRNGIFYMANRLYGVNFKEMPDAPKYHPDVNVYDVTDSLGNHLAVFMTDYFPRASKRQGAWMFQFSNAYEDADGNSVRPVVYNVGNFSKPTADAPSLLTIDEVETMFHEFGHGLHGMLTKAKYQGQSGTAVDRDFVELPSQIHEHWAFEPEMLRNYARHYVTGEVIPDALVEKMERASTHGQGFAMAERVSAALLDLAYGHLKPADGEEIDIEAFENEVGAKLGLPAELTYRYRSPYFKHIFGSDEYSSGYYTYMWAEVLDCDGFELFKERGIFDPATAKSFKENILETGGSEDPMTLYVRFRGQEPTPDAVLRKHGLL
ncbi:MAG: M3 family metallopeptidase [Muribaculaceae bacterium]|nr:M3 family metallopeptidase [Muribaculaceae bacterium]